MEKIIRSFKHAIKGLKTAYRRDFSIRIEVWASVLFITFGTALWPLEPYELLFLVLAYMSIVITELINTSFETAISKLHPEHDEHIGASKDIASAAVLMAVVFAAVVTLVIAVNHLL